MANSVIKVEEVRVDDIVKGTSAGKVTKVQDDHYSVQITFFDGTVVRYPEGSKVLVEKHEDKCRWGGEVTGACWAVEACGCKVYHLD